MRVETRKTLVLTREEQKAIADFYKIVHSDIDTFEFSLWDILEDIAMKTDFTHNEYNYDIKIIN